MKKINQLLLVMLLSASFIACTDAKGKRNASNDLKAYVDSVNRINTDYSHDTWQEIDNGYQSRARTAEAELAEMNEADKAELAESKKKYAELQAKYEMEMHHHDEAINSKVRLRSALFGEGKVGDDMTFAFVTSQNMLSVYQAFVDAVDANKDTYSREDWDEIKLLYEALDNHKNMDEKQLSGSDNLKIAALKVKVSTIYDTNRPGSKARENASAKE